MTRSDDDVSVRYRIDARDQIVFVDDAWHHTAATLASAREAANDVTGRLLWDFIGDAVTRRIYEQILARVRAGRVVQFTLRCDSAAYRRLLRMTIRADASGAVDFHTDPIESVPRSPVPLLSPDSPRSASMLRACGWCNRIDVGADEWTEVEEAVERLRLFERAALPHLSHGVCNACHAGLLATIEALEQE